MKGIHYIIDFNNLEFDFLNNLDKLKLIMEKTIKKSNVSIISKKFHKFKPQGLTGFYLLSESHLSFHTWPELGSISIDLYTCGDTDSADKAIDNLILNLESKSKNPKYKIRKLRR
jgi:S-adenosylmethionine decarboxylase